LSTPPSRARHVTGHVPIDVVLGHEYSTAAHADPSGSWPVTLTIIDELHPVVERQTR
jgi:hypothetical protein